MIIVDQERLLSRRNFCMVRKYHMDVLPANHMSIFYIELCISGGSYIKYTYMISWEHSHVVLQNRVSLSL